MGPGVLRGRGFGLGALGLGTFVIGTAALVVTGLLNGVAAGFAVSQSSAGYLVTAYALGICAGGPVLAAVTARAGRRRLLLVTIAATGERTALPRRQPCGR
jgi:MFS transporter, DHA1 family, inner membrane transport protein